MLRPIISITAFVLVLTLLSLSHECCGVTVIAYNDINGYMNWNNPFFAEKFETFMKNCPVKCTFSTNRKQVSQADVILFLASTFFKSFPRLPPKRKKSQLFALHSMEQPHYVPLLHQYDLLNKNFDLMLTYSQSNVYPHTRVANLPLSYFPSHVYPISSVLAAPLPFNDKTGTSSDDAGAHVVAFVSNCKKAGGEQRLKYLKELGNYIPIDHFGGCLKNKAEPQLETFDVRWPKQGQRRARKIKVLSQYKFYLAFENFPLRDYVSEKVYEGLIAGTVPVYRGAENIDSFLPEHSFINANDITPRDLAKMLMELALDEKKYNVYFDFKKRTLVNTFVTIANQSYCHPSTLCRLCTYYANAVRSG